MNAAFDGDSAIGRVLSAGTRQLTIVGVVGDVRYASLDREPAPAVYLPVAQEPDELICLLIDASVPFATVAPAIRRAISEVDPSLPALGMTTLGAIISQSIADRRFYTIATAAFGAVALLLTIAGLVTIVTRSIVERRKELAIRTALGASGLRLQLRVLSQELLPVAAGVAAGLAAAYAAGSVLASFLFGISPHHRGVYAAAGMLLVLTTTMAGFVASRRSARISPALMLRTD